MGTVLRQIQPTADLTHVRGLLSDYVAEVAARLLADFDIVFADIVPADSVHLIEMESMLDPPGFLFLAEVDGVAAGVCGVKDVGVGVGEVKRMYVDPRFRGRGVARALVERCLAEAEEAGFSKLRLESGIWMLEAHALYRSVGFTDIAEYTDREFHDVPESKNMAVFMERPVPLPSSVL